MNEPEYRNLPGLTATDIKAGSVSMRHMHASVTGRLRRESPALAWGTTVHAAILEPDKFWENAAVWTGENKRGKEWSEFKVANAGRTILDEEEQITLQAVIAAVDANTNAARLIRGSMHEVLRHFEMPTIGRGKCRFDGIAGAYFFDLKTTRAIGKRQFASQFVSLGYDLQVGWYSIAAPDRVCYIIAVESAAPFDVVVYHIPSQVVEAGRDKAQAIAARYRAAEAAGTFDGVDEGAGMVEFELPAWAGGRGEEVDISTGTMEGSEL